MEWNGMEWSGEEVQAGISGLELCHSVSTAPQQPLHSHPTNLFSSHTHCAWPGASRTQTPPFEKIDI
eukprot:scaffold5723_cov176-Ochromonas_danica.AAC.2